MNKFVSKFGVGSALFATFGIMSAISPARAAEEFLGTWNVTNCSGSNSSFIQLPPGQTEFGFGATDVAARLNNTGGTGSTAGAFVTLPNDGPFASMDFRKMSFFFYSNVIASHTTVRFCFRSDHGTGSITNISKKLSTMAGKTNALGWTLAQVNSRDFGGFFASNAVLEKVSFELQTRGVLEVGDTVVEEAENNLRPVQVQLDKQSCSRLNSCE